MIDDERLVIPAYLRSELDAADIREVGMGLIDAGFEPVEFNIYCVEYYTAGVGSDREVAALSTASEAIVENGSGAFFVTYDGFELEVHIEYTDNLGEPDIHLYGLGWGLRQTDVSEANRKAVSRNCCRCCRSSRRDNRPVGNHIGMAQGGGCLPYCAIVTASRGQYEPSPVANRL